VILERVDNAIGANLGGQLGEWIAEDI